ncbi:CWF19-like protein 1 [Actinia tenebrosa]|uniref:CWF19-like protein 1 n=1 Tax=Actinia tenebrosa TaxID=6105 RepID=A0A6P8IB91_ACTTE|nr:CWF19-like protein 1 [Actinia tenebrosa]
MTTMKVLVCGEVNGKINQLYTRVKNILKKNPEFELLLCVGSFFGNTDENKKEWDSYVNRETLAPIATYILGPSDPEEMKYFDSSFLEDGKELCENITFLGRKGILTTGTGLQIAYLSGTDQSSGIKGGSTFSQEDVESLSNKSNEDKFQGVDILLTCCWPQDIIEYTSKPPDVLSVPNGSKLVSRLCYKLRPRYHFASVDGIHYERAPYRNHQVLKEPSRHVTRFISLSYVGNKEKKKYMYAFNIVPMCHMEKSKLTEQPEDVTEFPYNKLLLSSSEKSLHEKTDQGGFFFDMSRSTKQGQKRRHDGSQPQRQPRQHVGPPPLKGDCWFCLGSPKVEKHLVLSVGNLCYLALAKGGLVDDHILICPIAHFESSVKLNEETLMETEKFKQALQRMFSEEGKSCVIYERNFYTQHLQLQVVPVPKMEDTSLKKIFKEEAEMRGMEMKEILVGKPLSEAVPIGAPYFVVEFNNGDRLLHRVRGKMDLQFGREVLACDAILNMPDRADWKECKVSMDREKQLAGAFRKRFQPFDFNL